MFRDRRFLLLLLVVVLALLLGFTCLEPRAALFMVKKFSYWFILAAFVIFLYSLRNITRETFKSIRTARPDYMVLSVLILCSGFVLTRDSRNFKVVFDEPLLVSVSQIMHVHREAFVPMRAECLDGAYSIIGGTLDKRPLFFPFLLSLVHDLTGYRPENGFILNALLSVCLLIIIYRIGVAIAGRWTGITGVLLLSSLPLFHQLATSSGFEVLQATMIGLLILLGIEMFKKPDDSLISAFVIGGVLLCQIRYESVLYALPVAGLVVLAWLRHRRMILPWPVILAPLLMLPYPWQNRVFEIKPGFWQLSGKTGATDPFSLSYVSDNIGHAINHFFTSSSSSTASILLSVCGILALPFCILFIVKSLKKWFLECNALLPISLFLFSLLILFGFLMTYFWGQLDDYVISRIGFPIHILLVLAVMLGLKSFSVPGRAVRWLAAIVACYLFIWTLPHSSQPSIYQRYAGGRVMAWFEKFIEDNRSHNYLYISSFPCLFIIHNQQAADTAVFNKNISFATLQMSLKTHEKILFCQFVRIDAKTKKEVAFMEEVFPSPCFKLNPIAEYRFTPITIARISELVDVVEPRKAEDGTEILTPVPRDEIQRQLDAFLELWAKNLP